MTGEKNTAFIDIKNISKHFGGTQALTDFSLSLKQGSFCCLLGPSGCGKSTALRLIAGLDRPDRGIICMGGRSITNIVPQKRNVGMVFQNYALFPHMNVAQNIAFGINEKTAEQQNQIVSKMLDMVRLDGYEHRSITELSGGEQQRVALARSLARNPQLLLLDEPFSNLDVRLKESMHEELFELIQQVNITTILVTHDQEEAMSLGDTIVLMNQGKIEQIGSPQELYNKPNSSFCANFLGRVNLFSRKSFYQLFSDAETTDTKTSYSYIAIRPESLKPVSGKEKGVELEITRMSFHGSFFRYTAKPTKPDLPRIELSIEQTTDTPPINVGERYQFTFRKSALRYLSC